MYYDHRFHSNKEVNECSKSHFVIDKGVVKRYRIHCSVSHGIARKTLTLRSLLKKNCHVQQFGPPRLATDSLNTSQEIRGILSQIRSEPLQHGNTNSPQLPLL